MFFLHGFMGSVEDFDFFPESFVGLDYVNALGIDVSEKPWDEITTVLWDQISDEKISLFGYSMGGRIALAMFAAQPDRVEKLVLCGTQCCPPVAQKKILPLPLGEGWGGGDQMKQVDQKDKKIGKDAKTKDGPEKLAPTLLLPRGQEGAAISRKIVDEERAIFLRDKPEAFLKWWSTLELFGPQKSPAWSLVKERRAVRMKNLAPLWANLLQSLSVSEQQDFSTLIKEYAEKIIFIYGENDERYKAFAGQYRKLGVRTIAVSDAWHAVHLDNPDGLLSALKNLF